MVATNGNVSFGGKAARMGMVILAALSLVGAGVVGSGTAHAIANGEPVTEGEYRFSVKLTMTGIPTADGGRRNSACSGALISRTWIITAGHCFRDENGVRVDRPVADLTTATVGTADLASNPGRVATVIAVRQSPTNDIAVAQLDQPIRGVRALALATRAPGEGDVLRLTGFGAETSENPQPSTILRTGQVTIVSVETDVIGVRGHAPHPDTSACPYDSGAPYFLERHRRPPVLVSIESTGPSCPHSEVEITARVDTIVPWIQSVIGGP